MKISISANKIRVYDEVAKVTSYVGAKQVVADATSYERIFTTDADRQLLEQYWVEACSFATESMKRFLDSVVSQQMSSHVAIGNDYTIILNVSSQFNTSLSDSMEASLLAFFVNYIVAKWLELTSKESSESYASTATSMLNDIKIKLHYKDAPKRDSGGGDEGDEDDGGFYYG